MLSILAVNMELFDQSLTWHPTNYWHKTHGQGTSTLEGFVIKTFRSSNTGEYQAAIFLHGGRSQRYHPEKYVYHIWMSPPSGQDILSKFWEVCIHFAHNCGVILMLRTLKLVS